MDNEINKVIGNPNNWHIEVYPKRAGDFGFASISSIKYDSKEAEDLAREIEQEIKRHVSGVSSCQMIYESWICVECENEFDTKKEAENCEHN